MIVGGSAILFLCMGNRVLEGLEDGESDAGFTEEKSDDGDSIVGNNTVSGGGAKPGQLGDPKILNMGPYDGIILKTGNDRMLDESRQIDTALVPNDGLYSYLSSQGPIK